MSTTTMNTSDERAFATQAGVLPQLEAVARLANEFFRGIPGVTPLVPPASTDAIAPALSSFLPLRVLPDAPPIAPGGGHAFEIDRVIAVDQRLAGGIFDAATVRRDFPILNEAVHGTRLVWLDN